MHAQSTLQDVPGDIGVLSGLEEVVALHGKHRAVRKMEEVDNGKLLQVQPMVKRRAREVEGASAERTGARDAQVLETSVFGVDSYRFRVGLLVDG